MCTSLARRYRVAHTCTTITSSWPYSPLLFERQVSLLFHQMPFTIPPNLSLSIPHPDHPTFAALSASSALSASFGHCPWQNSLQSWEGGFRIHTVVTYQCLSQRFPPSPLEYSPMSNCSLHTVCLSYVPPSVAPSQKRGALGRFCCLHHQNKYRGEGTDHFLALVAIHPRCQVDFGSCRPSAGVFPVCAVPSPSLRDQLSAVLATSIQRSTCPV